MSTGELDRLARAERLLENALHEADQVPVDPRAGRAGLARHLDQRRRAVRRRTIIGAAASVLTVVVTTSIVFAGMREEGHSLPAKPSPQLTLSPSGLPVGVLVGNVDRTEPGAKSTVRIVVRSDGTGVFNPGTVGDSEGPATADYPVEFVRAGPGSVEIFGEASDCYGRQLLTLDFAVRGRTILVEDVMRLCLVSSGLAHDMTGTTLRVLPLPGT
jgi:hypothetical protein